MAECYDDCGRIDGRRCDREWIKFDRHGPDYWQPVTLHRGDVLALADAYQDRGLHLDDSTRDGLSEVYFRTLLALRRAMPATARFDGSNLEALKHESETPFRGHGDCCDRG